MQYKGIVIYPEELSDYWLDRLEGTGLNFLGIHPVGGNTQGKAIEDAIEWIRLPETRRLIDRAERLGIAVEFEMHALSWLIPRSLFETQPEWFRMNENGERVADSNCCFSHPEVLEYTAERSAELAKIFETSRGRYQFWGDDVANPRCNCPRCREMSGSDAVMMFYNAVNEGIRSVFPGAGQSYLAYDDVIVPPEHVTPADGIFLEYAPMKRNLTRPMWDPESEMNKKSIEPVGRLLEVFGHKNAQVLDYWLDNSWFSGWKKPIQRFRCLMDVVGQDAIWYERAGFETITSFAIYLGEEYYKTFGEHFDVDTYSKMLGTVLK